MISHKKKAKDIFISYNLRLEFQNCTPSAVCVSDKYHNINETLIDN